ncbi:MAG: hypothetical protein SGI84_01440 [Gemmatimonadota bacterium]|nr:hypothetical protein [Gemmatimonadota bacterium]
MRVNVSAVGVVVLVAFGFLSPLSRTGEMAVGPSASGALVELGWVQTCGKCILLGCGHKVEEKLINNEWANTHSYCVALPDCDGHPGCSEAFAPRIDGADALRFPALLERAAAGDGQASIALVREYPWLASYNEGREAVQVLGCDGMSVVAHLPVSKELVALALLE